MIKVILIEYRFQTHSAHLVYFFSGKIVPDRRQPSSFQSHQATRKLKPDWNPWVERKDTDSTAPFWRAPYVPNLFEGFTLQSERFKGCRGPKNWSLEHTSASSFQLRRRYHHTIKPTQKIMGASCPSVVPFEILLAFEDASFEQLYLQWPFSMIVLTSKMPFGDRFITFGKQRSNPFRTYFSSTPEFPIHPKNTDSNHEKTKFQL